MGRSLNEEERRELDRRVAETEKKTGAQIVLAVTERSDDYPEIPWKAFALGTSIAGLAVIMLDLLRPVWASATMVLLSVAAVLAVGAGAALATILLPRVARFFLDRQRAEGEARQYAQGLFLAREVFATGQRRGILMLVSLFEHQVVVLPDRGLERHLTPGVLLEIVAAMTTECAAGRTGRALEMGLQLLEQALAASAKERSAGNELPDGIVEERGK